MDRIDNIESYSGTYSEEKFLHKLGKWAKRMGLDTVFCANILFCTLGADTTPKWVAIKIMAPLGYLIAPLDFIPDFIVPLGFVDDMAALVALFSGPYSIKPYISPAILKKAKERTLSMKAFSSVDARELDELIEKWNLIDVN